MTDPSSPTGERPRPQRRLTTIFFADVKDYSRMMDADEEGTLTLLKDRRGRMVGHIERFGGRVVSTSGDGLLAEFPSVVDATQCAAEIQRELGALNAHEGTPMHFRIGLNIGDVIVDGNDLYGEGVNVAARLQAIADPGGICISGAVFDQVRNKIAIGYEFMGPQQVKNIADPVPAYRVDLDPSFDKELREAAASQQQPRNDTPAAPGGPPPPQGAPYSAESEAFRRFAMRLAVVGAFLFAIDLITSPGNWWVQWPLLAFALAIAWRWVSRAGDRKIPLHERNWRFGIHGGDLAVERDSAHMGDIQGDVRVADGVSFKMAGTIHGDLVIGAGAHVDILGNVQGAVVNNGGSFRLHGTQGPHGRGARREAGQRQRDARESGRD